MLSAIDTIKNHQSVRKFTQDKITQEQSDNIDKCIMQSSSTCFLQFVTTIKIRNQDKLALIAQLSGKQEHIAQCDTFYMFCLDLTKFQHITKLQEPYGFKFLFAGINDCSLACQNALIAAESMGLGGVIIGGYKNGIDQISTLLKLPKGVVPLLGLCLGVVDKEYLEEQKPRLPKEWLIMEEEFCDPFKQATLDAYDEKMRQYYASRKYNKRDESWSEASIPMLNYLVDAQDLITYLKKQGFAL